MEDNNKEVNNQNNIPTNEELNSEINKVAEQSQAGFKEDPNVALDNAPIVEQPNEPEVSNTDNDLPQFNDAAQTIGKIKPDKQKSPIAMLVLFCALIAFILYMPEAVKLINEYVPGLIDKIDALFGIEPEIIEGINMGVNDEEPVKENEEPTNNTLKLLELSDTLEIKVNDLTITNINKAVDNNNNYIINLSIKNNKAINYTFSKRLYLDFYNANDVFINRALIDVDTINASSTIDVQSQITKDIFDSGTKVNAVFRSVDDYPGVKIENNTLTCENDNRTLIYAFKDNKLLSISDTQSYTKSSDLSVYTSTLMIKKNEINSMDINDGVTAVLEENETGYMTSISINYNTAVYENLPYKKDYYDKDTNPKVINFELTSKGYTCS